MARPWSVGSAAPCQVLKDGDPSTMSHELAPPLIYVMKVLNVMKHMPIVTQMHLI